MDETVKEGQTIMKKMIILISTVLILILSIFPVSASAESSSVTALNASFAGSQLSYNGTTASGVKAVAVLLFDPDGNLIIMDTCEVKNDGTFSGTIPANLTRTGVYTIKASDYEGGSFAESSFSLYPDSETNVATAPSATRKPTATPKPDETIKPQTSPDPKSSAEPPVILGPVVKIDEKNITMHIDGDITRAVVDDSALQEAIDQVLAGIAADQIKPSDAVIEFPKIDIQPGTSQGSIEFNSTSAKLIAENGIAVRVQIGNAEIHLPAEVILQASAIEGASSVRLVSGREEGLYGADNGRFMLASGEHGQPIGLPYSFALETIMADGSTQTVTSFDGTVSITVILTEQELAAIGNPENLKMVYVNPQTGDTEVLESVFDRLTGTLTFKTTHFSVFQLMETVGASASNTSYGMWWILWLVIGIAVAAGLFFIIIKAKRRTF